MVVARRFGQPPFDHVEHHVEAKVAIDVDVDLESGVPVQLRAFLEHVWRHDPLAVVIGIRIAVAIEVGITHLHQLADDRTVSKQLDLLREECEPVSVVRAVGGHGVLALSSSERGVVSHLLLGGATTVGEEVAEERSVVSSENLLVQLPRSGHKNCAGLVECRHPVLVEVADHLMQAVDQPFGAEQHRGELAEQQVEEAALPEVA